MNNGVALMPHKGKHKLLKEMNPLDLYNALDKNEKIFGDWYKAVISPTYALNYEGEKIPEEKISPMFAEHLKTLRDPGYWDIGALERNEL